MTSTTAAVLRAFDAEHAFETIELEDLRADEILVRVRAAGLCHTDLVPRSEMVAQFLCPIVLGHEGAGVVEAVGGDVTGIAVGDHVLLSFDSCGQCGSCKAGVPAYCAAFRMINTSGRRIDGSVAGTDAEGKPVNNRWFAQSSFAELAIATARNAVVVDPDLPLDVLAPLGCGLQTGAGVVLNEMNLQPGQTIAITGVGAVGLAAVMAAKIAGASEIVVADMHQSRLDLAVELGATRTVLSPVPDLGAALRGDTGGLDFALDTTAVEPVIRGGLAALRQGSGQLVLVGSATTPMTLDTGVLTGVKIGFALEGGVDPHEFVPRLVEHWKAGEFPLERLIKTYPLSDINLAEREMSSGEVIKPILLPAQ